MLLVERVAGHVCTFLNSFAEARLPVFFTGLLPVSAVVEASIPPRFIAGDHRSESPPNHDLGTIHHLINDVGDAHQSLGLPNRFTRQQAHLLKIARELRRRWKS